MSYKDLVLNNNEEEKRYELVVEGQVSFIEYERRGDTVFLTHTEVPEEQEGKGIASAMVEKVLTDIERQGLKMMPYCSYVQLFLKRHPEWNRIVAGAHNI